MIFITIDPQHMLNSYAKTDAIRLSPHNIRSKNVSIYDV